MRIFVMSLVIQNQAIEMIKKEVVRLVDLANLKLNRSFDYPIVNFDVTGSNAGKASAKRVSFNIKLAILDGNWDEYRNTVSHEVAHYIDYQLRNRSGHDSYWRRIHCMLGGNGQTYHSMKHESRLKEYLYDVNGTEISITSIRHNKIQKGETYHCESGLINVKCSYRVKEPLKIATSLKVWS